MLALSILIFRIPALNLGHLRWNGILSTFFTPLIDRFNVVLDVLVGFDDVAFELFNFSEPLTSDFVHTSQHSNPSLSSLPSSLS